MSDNSFSLIWKEFKSNFRSVAMVVLLFALWIIFQILTGGIFLTARNLNNLFLQMAFIGIACTGMVLVMVAGHIDLSAGSVIGFTGAVMAVMLQNLHAHFGVALVVTLIVGILIGAWNALWVAYFNIPAFIVTLSSELVFRGGVLGILHSKTVQPNNDMFRMVGQGYLPHPEQGIDIIAIVLCTIVILGFLILSLRSRDEKKKYGFQVASPVSFICKTGAICLAIIGVFVIWMKDRGVPFPILLLCLIVVAMTVLSTKAPFGKHVFAIGGNRDAARLSGINVKKTTAFVFVIAGFMTAIAGVVYTSRLNSAAISGGQGNELDIITACIIGGTSTMGGVGSIPGSILGALIIATLENGMSLMSLDSFSKYLVKGLVLLFAVVFDSLNRGKKGS